MRAAASHSQAATAGRRAVCQPIVCGLRFFSRPQRRTRFVQLQQAETALAKSVRLAQRAAGTATVLENGAAAPIAKPSIRYHGVHHVALLCKDLDRALDFYRGVLGLEVNPDRPHHKLPYRGAWLWIGPEMIHLMELDNPDPLTNRPQHGGRDRHVCIGVTDLQPLVEKLEAAGVPYTRSMSGRPALFFRDPDMNTLEMVEQEPWR